MPSSVIRAFAYRPGCAELEVTFTTGRRYVYSDVPRAAAEALRAAFAKGPHFNGHIRGRYPHRELAPDEPDRGGVDPALGWGGS
jgi:hypothetical protein